MPEVPTSTADPADAAAAKVDRLLAQLRSGPDPRAAVVAEELVRCLVQLYGSGLKRIVDIVGPEHGPDLCADPLVESLLLVHDLHPVDAGTRIRRALERARPRTGEVDYLGIDDAGVVRVRLSAGGHGCGSSARSVRLAIETIVQQAAPETAGVEVEIPASPAPLLQVSRRPGS
jgi:Fe-S cluster biogenesis protein NfuA